MGTVAIAVHEKGDYFGSSFSMFSSSVQSLTPYFSYQDIIIGLKEEKYMTSEKYPCIADENIDIVPLRKCIVNHFEQELGCKMPWTKQLSGSDAFNLSI